jgi:hypothetical protein
MASATSPCSYNHAIPKSPIDLAISLLYLHLQLSQIHIEGKLGESLKLLEMELLTLSQIGVRIGVGHSGRSNESI